MSPRARFRRCHRARFCAVVDSFLFLGACAPADTLTKWSRLAEPEVVPFARPLTVVPIAAPPDLPATADAVEPAPGTSPLDDFVELLGEEDAS